jgi:hypothetical protein
MKTARRLFTARGAALANDTPRPRPSAIGHTVRTRGEAAT